MPSTSMAGRLSQRSRSSPLKDCSSFRHGRRAIIVPSPEQQNASCPQDGRRRKYARAMPSSLRPPRDSNLTLRAAPDEVTIDDWGIRDRPLGSSLALTLAAGASWLAAWATDAPLVGLVVAVILAVVAWRTWLPVRYEIGATGVTQSIL